MPHYTVIYKPSTSPWTCLLTNLNGDHQVKWVLSKLLYTTKVTALVTTICLYTLVVECSLLYQCTIYCTMFGAGIGGHYDRPWVILGGPWADWLGFWPMSDPYNAYCYHDSSNGLLTWWWTWLTWLASAFDMVRIKCLFMHQWSTIMQNPRRAYKLSSHRSYITTVQPRTPLSTG